MLRFTGIQSYSYTEQRKVETDVDRMTGIELATLQLRRPRTNRLSYVCFTMLGFLAFLTPSHLGYLPPYFLLLLLKSHSRSNAFLPAIMETRWKMFAMKFDVAATKTTLENQRQIS